MASENFTGSVESARDMLVIALVSAKSRVSEAILDISENEYHWEPLSESERLSDMHLPTDMRRVWRVFQKGTAWVYDYMPEVLETPPFTTIAWIMNHIAQTSDMYLYCVRTGKPEGIERSWDDLPVYSDYKQTCEYIFRVMEDSREYLDSIPANQVNFELNKLTPAPWGEMRPVNKNIWGGIICHAIEHAAQIATLKNRIRYGY